MIKRKKLRYSKPDVLYDKIYNRNKDYNITVIYSELAIQKFWDLKTYTV